MGEDIENFRFNTAISALMILWNKFKNQNFEKDTVETFLKLLAPFAPHFSEELWNMFGNKKSIHLESWPEYNSELIEEGDYDLIIQVNGKSRDRIRISKGLERSEIEKIVLTRDIVRKYIENKEIQKIIFVPNRLINIVV